MKKIIISILSLAVLLVGQNASAAVTWNSFSNDCKTIAVANYTTNTGIVDPCWPLSSVSASPGQSINVRIYYHNTGNSPATNTRISLNAPTGTGYTQNFTGQISSDQGNLSFGPATINLTSSQSLTFGSMRWYPNQSQNYVSLPNGQTGNELINGGVNIGTIAPTWAAQGSIVASFYVNVTNPTGTLTGSNSSCVISAGNGSCTIPFSWNTLNPVNVSTITRTGLPGTYITGNSGSQPFTVPYGSSTFYLNHYFNNQSNILDSSTVSASCASGTVWNAGTSLCTQINNCEITSFTSDKTVSAPGDIVNLSWSTNYCTSVSIPGVGTNMAPNVSNKSVWPTITTTYVLTGYGSTSVSPSQSLTVIVGGPVGAPGFPAGAPGYGK